MPAFMTVRGVFDNIKIQDMHQLHLMSWQVICPNELKGATPPLLTFHEELFFGWQFDKSKSTVTRAVSFQIRHALIWI